MVAFYSICHLFLPPNKFWRVLTAVCPATNGQRHVLFRKKCATVYLSFRHHIRSPFPSIASDNTASCCLKSLTSGKTCRLHRPIYTKKRNFLYSNLADGRPTFLIGAAPLLRRMLIAAGLCTMLYQELSTGKFLVILCTRNVEQWI